MSTLHRVHEHSMSTLHSVHEHSMSTPWALHEHSMSTPRALHRLHEHSMGRCGGVEDTGLLVMGMRSEYWKVPPKFLQWPQLVMALKMEASNSRLYMQSRSCILMRSFHMWVFLCSTLVSSVASALVMHSWWETAPTDVTPSSCHSLLSSIR